MFRRLQALLVVCIVLPAFFPLEVHAGGDLLALAQSLFKPIPDFPRELKGNPSTPAKLKLGKMLYFDPRLSTSHLISCNTCHNLGLAGADLQETSVGHAWQKGARNAPTVLNAVFNIAQFWDGRAEDLAEQAKGPVQASVEMSNTPERAVATLKSIPEYVKLFRVSFPDDADPVTFDNMAKAIEVFDAALLTPHSAFDRYLKGEKDALTSEEKQGLRSFIDKKCAGCHKGINIGGTDYYPFGVIAMPPGGILPQDDTGRFRLTFDPDDVYVFKSQSLRNVALTPPYFHSGKVWKLSDAVRIMGSIQLGMRLEAGEIEHITAFLRALTGEQPRLELPILPPNSGSTPRPSLEKTTASSMGY